MGCACRGGCCDATDDHMREAPAEVKSALWAIFVGSTKLEDPFWAAARMYDAFRRSSEQSSVQSPEVTENA